VGNNVLNDDSFKVFLSADPNRINYGKSVNRGKVIEIAIMGKPSIIMTIANPAQSDEILRRLPICFLDEGVNQTREILKRQAAFAKLGKSLDFNPDVLKAIKNLQRVSVRIPFADRLINIFNPDSIIVRTAFPRFLDYIKSCCALHQFQRQVDGEGYYLAEKEDYEIAAMMLKKTTSNIWMIPLTKLKQSLYNIFKDQRLPSSSLDELGNLPEIQELGISESWLRKNLDWLVSRKFLKRSQRKVENIKKPLYEYSYNNVLEFSLPSWEELMNSSPDKENKEINKNNPDNPNNPLNGLNGLNSQRTEIVCSLCGAPNPSLTQDGVNFYCKPCGYKIVGGGE
jgi:DNA-directed RNA polymerase subunit RPC12/RpoP